MRVSLSIGDWVRYKDDYPDVSLRGQYAIVKGLDGRVVTSKNKSGQSEHPDWLEPVPLTEAVLALNGFKKGSYVGGWLLQGFPFRVIIDSKTAFADFVPPFDDETVFYCATVHELQHCLRLCGFSSMAMNFKVERNEGK